ncbi:hypothetical protein C9374_011151 [Naegleria lovaniensis]|uniref:Uncharacterized protein n=1 Tax=Naegleria lovaniensis TaxID=51637 RepID=A0AA88GA22_NAELO|nr:uncharacterized protein C9374_011151 [Naegleria lovaniensis]KAG2374072.1 hypothetical protein C9374_011151 [Naegleria lovaniensis]
MKKFDGLLLGTRRVLLLAHTSKSCMMESNFITNVSCIESDRKKCSFNKNSFFSSRFVNINHDKNMESTLMNHHEMKNSSHTDMNLSMESFHEKPITPHDREKENPLVFHHGNSLRHLSDDEKEAIVSDMATNWRDHFPTVSSYTRKMNQLYDLSKVDELVKAQRILLIEARHLNEYKSWRYFSRALTILLIVSIIYQYYRKITYQNALIDKYYSQDPNAMKKALEHQKFEISDEEAEERLLLMDKKKEEQATGTANLKQLKDRFHKSQLGEAKLYNVGMDYYAELERQAKLEAQVQEKRERGEIPKPYIFYSNR